MEKISAAIITFNEEKNIERCLESLQGIVDEIVVVDSFSRDATPDLCRGYGVTFVQNPFAGHIEQKNFAIDRTTHDIVLSLDADEALDEELAREILRVKEDFQADGYVLNRLTHYVDRWVKHCGWYPDRKLRLFRKDKGRWGGTNPHDIVVMAPGARTSPLKGHLLHYSYPSVADHVRQTNYFTTIAAKAAYAKGVRSNAFKIYTRPVLKFFRDYVFRLGFLDGIYGFVICYINALSALLKYSKLRDLQRGKPISES